MSRVAASPGLLVARSDVMNNASLTSIFWFLSLNAANVVQWTVPVPFASIPASAIFQPAAPTPNIGIFFKSQRRNTFFKELCISKGVFNPQHKNTAVVFEVFVKSLRQS